MKHVLKKSCLLGLSLLLVFSIIGFIGVTNLVNGESTTIRTNPSDLHESSLFSLYLSGVSAYDSWLNVGSELSSNYFLSVLNGLIIGKNHTANTENLQLVLIGGGNGNTVSADNAGIGGGQGNVVSAINGGIGGGQENSVAGNGGVVVGGSRNKVDEGGVVVGGSTNNFDNKGVVLGGKYNGAGTNSLVLGENAKGGNNSFAWNQTTSDDTAGIKANNGVLIGTVSVKPGVALVVNGAIKLGNGEEPTQQGEINQKDGCIKVVDKDNGSSHVLGKTSENKCDAGKGCQFGKTILQDGEIIKKNGTGPRQVKAYKSPYSTNCENERIDVKCNNGHLESSQSSKIYPYCYKISSASDPRNKVIN